MRILNSGKLTCPKCAKIPARFRTKSPFRLSRQIRPIPYHKGGVFHFPIGSNICTPLIGKSFSLNLDLRPMRRQSYGYINAPLVQLSAAKSPRNPHSEWDRCSICYRVGLADRISQNLRGGEIRHQGSSVAIFGSWPL